MYLKLLFIEVSVYFMHHNSMKKGSFVDYETKGVLAQMGCQIKLARLRRRLPADLVSERANISRSTLNKIEKGSSSVSIGAYAAVLHALGDLEKDLLNIAKDEAFDRLAEDNEIKISKRIRKTK